MPERGDIRISKKVGAVCGKSAGFSVGVSWSSSKYTGGVIGMEEARRLANHILKALAEVKEAEEDLVEACYKRHEKPC